MQLFKTGEKSIIAAPGFDNKAARMLAAYGIEVAYGKTVPERKYPRNISYNVLNAGGCFVHKCTYTEPEIKRYAELTGKRFINVKQGYSACTSVYIPFSNLIITGDEGIIRAAKENNYNVCIFEHTSEITLRGYGHGFIGGCCGVLDGGRRLIVNGSFTGLYKKTAGLLERYGIDIIDAGTGRLEDIGGIITFTY